ncbi:hypothetical protein HDV01_007727 [Terramyces sp. JEL0728]|nr:hypothetical protein HDV01_007727 [Terramyces sp. JEL0728]
MLVIYTEKHKEHNPKFYFSLGRMEDFPEMPSRAEAVIDAIREREIGSVIQPRDFGLEPIKRIHSERYIEYLLNAYGNWLKIGGNPEACIPDTFAINLDPQIRQLADEAKNKYAQAGSFAFDTAAVITKGTYGAAYEAVQVALTGAEIILNSANAAFALCRPPGTNKLISGHHSETSLAGGFCYFNSAAIAAQYLIDKTNSKVAVLDVDYHHGNGTQTIFYKKNNPLFVSLHGKGDYPYFWGSELEQGDADGLGYNVNVPLPIGTNDEDYLASLKQVIDSKIKVYQPTYLVVSLGLDTFGGDPVGGFSLTSAAFCTIGELIASINVPTLFVMEGGYAVKELGENGNYS